DRDFARLEAGSPRYNEWQRLMDTFQSRVPEAQADEHWAAMSKVFDLSDYH
ncbi:MAG: L-rhamnose mutarotase, partial [Caldilineaceae bacterium SB0666_bin_21]|nr:L-rhamnose mutarotase [Caldilineaceae bacterium SB0666_bin_21]